MRQDVENIVGEHFGVTIDQLHNPKCDSRNTMDARHFLWYILHHVLGYKMSTLVEEYHTTERNIAHHIAKIKDGVQLQPFYARHCGELMKQLREMNIL